MAQIVLGPSRAYPNVPTIGDDIASHTQALNAIVEALNIHERRIGKSVLDSFVRVRELETLGLADIEGNIVTDASTEESTTHHHDSTYLRLDGTNDPVTGSVSFSGGLSATGLTAGGAIDFTGATGIDVTGVVITGLSSDDLSDVASIGMLDEAETVLALWTFNGGLDVNSAGTEVLDLTQSGSVDLNIIKSGTGDLNITNSGTGSIVATGTFNVVGDIEVTGTVDGRDIAADGALIDSALQNIVEDTTPQLGGDLDTNSFNIFLDTSHYVQVGVNSTTTAPVRLSDTGGLVWYPGTATGGWARGIRVLKNSDSSVIAGSGFLGNNEVMTSWGVGFGASWWAGDEVFRVTPTTGIDVTGSLGAELITVKDSGGAGTAANPYIAFRDSANARIGYVGVGSTGSNDLYLTSDAGGIRIVAGGGIIYLDDNVNVAGTVDGRDLATDGAKLDGIESGATADQTAGEIEAIVNHDNLLGFVANEHIDWTNATQNFLTTGTGVFTGNSLDVQGTSARIRINETDATLDNKEYEFLASSEAFQFSLLSDDRLTRTSVMQVNRTGTTVDNIVFSGNVDVSAGLDVTGNITVTGTVDGRDIATDGTKLDGIESGATADQTAGEIEAIVNHDNLLGFVANEHIDWTNATQNFLTTGTMTLSDNQLIRPVITDYGVKHQTLSISTATTPDSATIDCTAGNSAYLDLESAVEDIEVFFTNPPASGTYGEINLVVQQGTTARAITWPAAVDWKGDTPILSTTNNTIDVFHFFTIDGGTTWIGTYALDATPAAVGALNDLTDVTLTSPADGAVLIYDTGTAQWRDFTLSGDATMTDSGVVTVADNSHNHLWSNITSTPTTVAGYGITDALTDITGEPLSDLSDVTITTIAANEILKWNGTAWINNTLAEAGVAAASHTHVIADVTDFTDNSTNWDTAFGWGNHASAGYLTGITAEPLSDLSDVTITTIAANEILKWNGTAWINNTLAEAGIAAASHTHVIADVTDFTDNSTNWNAAYNDKINSASFATGTGILTLTQQDAGTVTVDLDGRYLTSYTETDTLADVTGRGATTATASTFSGGINMADSDLNRPVLEDYGVKHQTLSINTGTTPDSATIDCTVANSAYLDLESAVEDIEVFFTNPPASGTYGEINLVVQQGTTARDITWPAAVDWKGATPVLSTTNNAIDVFHFFTIDGGTTWIGTYAVDGAAATGATQLDDLSDVTLTTPADGAIMIYDTGTAQWRDFVLSGDATMTDGGVVTVADNSHNHLWSNITSTPTTVAGYGITDALTTATNFGGDVSGTYNAIVVANDSHTHAFDNLTGKTSGTGNYQTTGDMIADNFEATGTGPNTTPGTDDAYFGGYGVLGDRTGNVYVSNVSGPVALNYGGVHNVNTKLATTSTGISVTGNIVVTGTVDGVDLAAIPAANIAAGSLVSGVNPYITGSATSSAFQVLFGNTTSGTSGAASILKDSAASQFTYNPSTNTLYAANASSSKVITNGVFMNELASAGTDVGGDGQLWVKNNTPNDLYFTTDSGLDYPVAYARYRVTADTTLDGANVSETLGVQHINGVWYSDNATAYTLTLQASGVTTFPVGAQMTIWNEGSGTLTITEGSGTTLYLMDGSAVTDTAGGCTMAQGGYATLIRKSTTVYLIMGAGLTA